VSEKRARVSPFSQKREKMKYDTERSKGNKNLKWLHCIYTKPIDNVIFFSLAALSSSHVSVPFRQCRIYNRKKEKKIKRNTLHGKGSKKSLGSFRTGNRIKANETTSEQLDSI
jgi:hypothetical protein